MKPYRPTAGLGLYSSTTGDEVLEVEYYIEYTEPTYRYVQPARSMKAVYLVAPRRNRVLYW
ncbi:hypothetical protein T265_06429 [Opisthorchis viverrini]|uniref:Uncharacterized protein n=1 Tax=Opisthorchis viverrini TaxID=6198 RepID=A0A074ZKL3_OPIVI|nr:hypothetical protein T265_06429 [Opisthorchis viverrini]KER26312.1 hypothetical protein T265_06429 [Opisthorchis viverrini]